MSEPLTHALPGYVEPLTTSSEPIEYGPVEAVERLTVQPGDVVVVRCRAGTSEQKKHEVAEVMQRALPGYVRVVIGSVVEGLTVVTPEADG